MPDPDTFTGERFVPGAPGEIAYEHCHRYAFARQLARGRRVLDAACGTGYGSALMADVAVSVVGIDIDAGVVADASAAYASRQNLRFEAASVSAIPLPDASVDLVVSFETIEHIGADDQARMLLEFARVLAPGGLLVLSSPNRLEYSDARSYRNPFHVRELDRGEL
ncbi:MAG: class I SAM-dependent methyltransferase, partial [Casimicrobiaceae bacterium]